MTIGPYTVSRIETGDFKLDGGAMFGVVPKPLWSRPCPADELNRIAMTARCLLLESSERKILIDCGIGDKDDAKFRDIYAIDFTRNTLEHSLAQRGIGADQITDVIYTHLHFDHAGGSTRREGTRVVPVFARARHFVQRRQWEQALARFDRDRASYLEANYVPVMEAGLLELLDGDVELFPGIHMLLSDGHTPALQTVKLSDGATTLWYPTDLLPLAAHIPLPYIMGYDLYPVTTLADKQKYLARAADENWILVFEHDPAHPATRVKRDEKGRIVQAETVSI
ncbi:MBL fold metallo-hydrolase [candidate division KSB1 bacterium]|nr:MBL fold metallo-hydrolase [candidate division KSB1 bacterium]